jgi:hypothetical protein
MRFRKLRIAFSATCLIAFVLLIALWLRSYWREDTLVHRRHSAMIFVVSLQGEIEVDQVGYIDDAPDTNSWDVRIEAILPDKESTGNGFAFNRGVYDNEFAFTFPQWCPVLVAGLLAAVPWLPWWSKRFTLRTLLIATTLVAVVLGLIVAVL